MDFNSNVVIDIQILTYHFKVLLVLKIPQDPLEFLAPQASFRYQAVQGTKWLA